MEPIAIIGSSCRLPGGVDSPAKLWELLSDPQNVSQTIPSTRFSNSKFHHQNPSQHGQTRVSKSYFISQEVSHFDAEFFGIKPIEAKAIEPQQRMLLEVVYEALESAGLPMETLEGSQTAVYVGAMSADYETTLLHDPESMPTYTVTGIARSMLANRISYFFDWHGPSITIDTACSASIVAIHQAVQALRSGTGIDLAIAAGSNLLLRPEPFIAGSKINLLSPSGCSRMWDEKADGYARGEGVGVLVLKPLREALRAGDHIESIIRETGLNHDGRTKGITMPSASAQESLIRGTYERAGLNLSDPGDRCQYFEAHGTGTQAGDPIEAKAIRSAFFTSKHYIGEAKSHVNGTTNGAPNGTANGVGKAILNGGTKPYLHVGSIKTVIGHTEGTAGIAGVLKASLAMQHGYIPPNLHFVKLNPKVQPFYEDCLRLPTRLTPWPVVAPGEQKRASVNSFGFGGTNGHIILESHEHESPRYSTTERDRGDEPSLHGPIILSAATGRSLRLNVEAFYAFLQKHPQLSLRDLTWTTQCRRSCLPYRAAFSANSINTIASKLEIVLSASPDISETPPSRNITQPRVLAIFTGQGAQWPQMGRDLILSSSFVSQGLDRLDKRLQSLPLNDRPSWTLRSELLASKKTSRMDEASISQPLTTALEILLWDLICATGTDKSISAVVGHSGGETAAAYASGYISAEDGICISYYRGLHSKLARDDTSGQRGAMIAIESTVEEAEALVKLPYLNGKVCIAAYNSPESITLAGNEDSILFIKKTFESNKKFVRLIKVDNAYHSHHMLSCSGALLKSLRSLDINVTSKAGKPKWFSSVLSNDEGHELPDLLRGEYWNQNMVNPVRFSQAVCRAVESQETFDMAIEIGPHPALKGPTLKTLSQFNGNLINLPYTGLLQRGRSDVESFSDALGLIWKHLGPQGVNFRKFSQVMRDDIKPRLLKSLPSYQWSHESYWQESRLSQEYRLNHSPQNELLGSIHPTMVAGQILWRNFLRLKELSWLSHHSIQGQVVFPAAAYISMAVDAATAVETRHPPQLIEILDLRILHPMIIADDDIGTEITFALSRVSHSKESWEAEFSISAALEKQKLALVVTGRLKLTHGTCDIPESSDGSAGLHNLDSERFYSTIEHIGYHYTGPFRALSSLKAGHNRASGDILNKSPSTGSPTSTSVALLDTALQSNFLPTYRSGSGRLNTMPVLTGVEMVRIVPRLWNVKYSKLSFNYFASQDAARDGAAGDLEIYEPNATSTIVQIQGVLTKPLKAPQNAILFSETIWKAAHPKLDSISPPAKCALEVHDMAIDLERLTYFYQQKLHKAVSSGACPVNEPSHRKFLDYIDHNIASVFKDQQPHVFNKSMDDSNAQISQVLEKYPDSLDAKLIQVVGEHMVDVLCGTTTILEHMLKDHVLNRFYAEGLGFPQFNNCLSHTISQICHRYPNMHILEIGAGTGGATKNILQSLENSAYSYTFTDISSGFFNKAEEMFTHNGASGTICFQTLDVEKDIADQGFVEHSYDLIIASLVLHATEDLEATMRNVRRLLKPGGFLVMLEITDNSQMRFGFIFGSLPGWWRSIDGRLHSPCVDITRWRAILSSTGFSGIDTVASADDPLAYPFSVIVSQAVNEDIVALREPLKLASPLLSDLTILGDVADQTSVANRLQRTLKPYYTSITVAQVLAIDNLVCESRHIIVDARAFNSVIQHDVKSYISSIRRLFDSSSLRSILLISNKRATGDAWTEMGIGVFKSLRHQYPHILLLCINIDIIDDSTIAIAAGEALNLKDNQTEKRSEGVLWSTEYDVRVVNGEKLIPRCVPTVARSDRHRSRLGPVIRQTNLTDSDVSQVQLKLHKPSGRFIFYSSRNHSLPRNLRDNLLPRVEIRVAYSLQTAILTESQGLTGNLFLIVGTVVTTGQVVAGFCDQQALLVTTWASWVVPWNFDLADSATQLVHLGMNIVAHSTLSNAPRGTTVVVLEPSFLASGLKEAARLRDIELLFLSGNPSAKSPENLVHPQKMPRILQAMLPKEPCVALNVGGDKNQFTAIVDKFSHSCHALDTDDLFSIESRAHPNIVTQDLTDLLDNATRRLPECSANTPSSVSSVDVGSISGTTPAELDPEERLRVLNWTSGMIPVQARALQCKGIFTHSVTYWIVGLAPEYATSVCEWMVENGARFILILSSPKCEESQIERLRNNVAQIESYDLHEISCKELESISKNSGKSGFPKVGGVLQASIILPQPHGLDSGADSVNTISFSIDTTRHLAEIFQDTPLDFYLVLSPADVVTGQSVYLSAAFFAAGVVQKRLSRNLSASVLNVSEVYFGENYYLEHQKGSVRPGYQLLSEEDFFGALVEAINAGSHYGSEYEVTVGVALMEKNATPAPKWAEDPKFGHLLSLGHSTYSVAEGNESKPGPVGSNLKAAVLQAKSPVEALEVVTGAFIAKLQAILHIRSKHESDRSILDRSGDSIGIDSLIAVEIQAWFRDELEIQLPVMEIMNGETIGTLLEHFKGSFRRVS